MLFEHSPQNFKIQMTTEKPQPTAQPRVDWRVLVAAIAGLTAIEIYVLSQDINGTLLLVVMSAIAGIAGWIIPTPYTLKKTKL